MAENDSRQRWSRVLDVALAASILLAVVIKVGGGFVLEVLFFEMTARTAWTAFTLAAVLWTVRALRSGTLRSVVRTGGIALAWTLGVLVVVGLLNWAGDGLLGSGGEPLRQADRSTTGGGLEESNGWNVLLVSIDTLRADHLGCYGYRRDTSPNIDRLAAESVLFRNQIASAPDTLVSHASMLTSTNPTVHGALVTPPRPVHDEALTLAEVLKAEGFKTAAITNGGQLAREFNLTQGFDLYTARDEQLRPMRKRAIRWWRENGDTRRFLFFHTYQVHTPYRPRPGFPYAEGYEGELPAVISEKVARRINRGELEINEADREYIVALYDGEISHTDFQLDKLFEGMRADGSWEKTLVIVTSDHGEEFGEHGSMATHSHTLYDELLKVPFLLRLPGQFGGTEVQQQTRGIDLAPTILDALGIPIPDSMQGVSLLPLVTGQMDGPLPPAVSERTAGEDLVSWRTEDAKLIYPKQWIGSQSWFERLGFWRAADYAEIEPHRELYLLRDDPRELAESYSNHAWKGRVLLRDLTSRLEGDLRLAAPETSLEIDERLRDRLEALGYLQ